MQDTLTFTFLGGYHDIGNNVDVPEGVLIAPSYNVLYDMNARLSSFKGLSTTYNVGGTRAFMLDRDVVAFLGNTSGTTMVEGFGNVVQGVGKSIWYVGNEPNVKLKLFDLAGAGVLSVGGTSTSDTLTVPKAPPLESTVSFTKVNALGSAASDFLNAVANITFDGTTDRFTWMGNTLANGNTLRIVSGAPQGFSNNTTYYVVNRGTPTNNSFQLSLTNGGGAITSTDTGTDIPVVVERSHGLADQTKVKVRTLDKLPTGFDTNTNYYYFRLTDTTFRALTTYLVRDIESWTSVSSQIVCKSNHNLQTGDVVKIDTYTAYGATYIQYLVGATPTNITSDLVFYAIQVAGNDKAFRLATSRLNAQNNVYVTLANSVSNANAYTALNQVAGGTEVVLTDDGVGQSIAKFSAANAAVRFTTNSSTGILTWVSGQTAAVNSSSSFNVESYGKLPTPLQADTLYYVYYDPANGMATNQLKLTETLATPRVPINIEDDGVGQLIIDKNPFLRLTFRSVEPKMTATFNENTDTFTLAGNNLENENIVILYGTVPQGFTQNTTYYVINKSGNNFQLSATLNGGAVTSSGSSTSINVTMGLSKTLYASIADGDTSSKIAAAIRDVLRQDSAISENFFVTSSNNVVTVEDRKIRTNSILFGYTVGDSGLVTGNQASVDLGGGGVGTEASVYTTPHFAKWNGTGWDNPVSVGLRELEEIDKPIIEVTTPTSRSFGFGGFVQGSRTARLARKRYGTVSIASPPSNLVTASETGDSLTVTIPPPDPDGSAADDNSWFLYFTFKGEGSTATHKLFPLEISESELSGAVAPTLKQSGNAKYLVLSQSSAVKAERVVEVEFNDNDLIAFEPYEDYYPAEPCKFIMKLGNVMCLVGTGDDGTGVDVSFPNNYEAYSPDWRDWLSEVPVAVTTEAELGYFWICTANNTYIASWTGVTQDTSPIVLEKRSSLLGAIGQSATVCVGGVLYGLSKGLIPFAITPEGQVNTVYGARVLGYFSKKDNSNNQIFTDKTILFWDGVTNSIVFACGNTAIAYQIDNNLWSAPISLPFNAVGGFSINGISYLCQFDSVNSATPPEDTYVGFKTREWNSGTGTYQWNVTSSFSYGQSGRSLKDIIQVEAVMSSTSSDTITFGAYKNFNTSSLSSLASTSVSAGSMISVRQYAESLDYDTISASISGNKGGQTIHMAIYTVDVHRNERLS